MSQRCLIVQSDGEHKGQDGWTPNAHLRECHALRHAFIQNGVDADVWGLRHDGFRDVPDFESYDLVLCAENYEMDWLPDFGALRRPVTIHWIVDLHCREPDAYRRLSEQCDVVLHSTRSLMPAYQALHPRKLHLWFPNGVDDRHFDASRVARDRTRDLIFVGSDLPARREAIRTMRRRAGLETFFATGADMIELVASARIHFNRSLGPDLNYRCFETIGLGTCLLTNDVPDLDALGFEDGVTCLVYRSMDEAVAKARDALASGSWRAIGEAGHRLSRQHTYVRRVKGLLDALASGDRPEGGAPSRPLPSRQDDAAPAIRANAGSSRTRPS